MSVSDLLDSDLYNDGFDDEEPDTHVCRVCGASCDCLHPGRDCMHCEENWQVDR